MPTVRYLIGTAVIAAVVTIAVAQVPVGGFAQDGYTFSRTESAITAVCDSNPRAVITALAAVAEAVDAVGGEKLTGQWVIDTFMAALLPAPDDATRKRAITDAKRKLLDAGLADDDAAVTALETELSITAVER